jgi:GTPase SAR1 family protein
VLSNFLSDSTETPISESYRPTHVVRILEFESQNLNVNNRYAKADVELWDASGNHSFESSWPAIQRDAHGVIFVFDPEREQDARELEVFYSEFVEKRSISDAQCVVFAHFREGAAGGGGRKGVKLCELLNYSNWNF